MWVFLQSKIENTKKFEIINFFREGRGNIFRICHTSPREGGVKENLATVTKSVGLV